ncbi:MAG: MHS family MFS transporter [Acidimicrobiia bacterium]|nr:MHS family MFS transporter [Acidimicrobiia bacterium]
MATADAAPTQDQDTIRRVIWASFIGTTIEWYDFILYGTSAALVFSRLFFPNVDSFTGTLSAFGTFAVGFIARPVGGLVFGHFGDRLGRKSMLVISLLIMGVATFIIGLLPTYHSIGILAPILLVSMRFAQGLGVGGEWGGAVLMAVEHSAGKKRGFHGSWPQMGVPAGLLLSTVAFSACSSAFTEEQFFSWGWRLPFLASIALIGVGLFIRLRILETPAFLHQNMEARQVQPPIATVLRSYRRNVLVGMGMRFAENGTFYILTVFVLSYGESQLRLPRSTMLTGVILASLFGLFATPAFGALSDRIGRRPVYLGGALFTVAFAFPFFWLLDTRSPLLIWLAIVLGVNLGHDAMYGPQAAFFSELFGTHVRYTGASLSYQLSSVFAGGLAPLIATGLLARFGSAGVAAYVVVMGMITVVSTLLASETFQTSLAEEPTRPAP